MIFFTRGRGLRPTTLPDGRVDVEAVAHTLLRSILAATVSTGLISLLLSFAFGAAQSWGAVFGALMALIAFGLPPAVMKVVAKASPPAVMAAGMGGYLLVTSLLGIGFLILDPAAWVSQRWLGWTLFAGTVASTIALMVTMRRMRLPVFEPDGDQQGDVSVPSAEDSR